MLAWGTDGYEDDGNLGCDGKAGSSVVEYDSLYPVIQRLW